ncbi:hypothetical protein BDN72DRAFT_865676 [Pluteus cervinus]|uniref:Uncharacterized protein n=1 Tax=Pluteus cervinus TaxID=181527 RepID=A0ACD2ZYW9_9AGAR|nr:hypothetical protein BDN72DRAFT_865676 [Pluteus cervinus]
MVEAEFNWMDREFRHDIAGIKARAEAFEQLSVDAARGIVDKLPVSVQYTPNTNQGVLYMKVWYLWAYARDRPGLDEAYMKARVQYMSELDQGMVTLPGRTLGRHLDISSLVQANELPDKFLVPRFLRCLQTMAKNHAIANEVSQEMWSIIGDLVEYSFRHSHTEYLLTLGNLFDALHQGLESPTPALSTIQVTIQDTINHILEGLAFLWKLHPDEPTPRLKDDNAKHMEKFVHLINHLTCYVQVPQPGPAASHTPSQTRDGPQETVASKSSHVVPTKEKITLRDDQWAKWDALTTLLGKWTEALQKVHSRDATLVPAKSTASALPSAPSTSVQGNT